MAEGLPPIRESEGLWRVENRGYPSNTYIRAAGEAGECLVVDPGLDGDAIEDSLTSLGLRPRWIFCTHGHFDHIGSAARLQQKYQAPVFLHSADVATMNGSNFLLMAFKLPYRVITPELQLVEDGFSRQVGSSEVRFRSSPGHTPGSCVLFHGGVVFTGDSLYSKGIGLSRLPGEDPNQLRKSLHALWNDIPDDAMLYPGHGESARFSWVKGNNQALLSFLGLKPNATRLR